MAREEDGGGVMSGGVMGESGDSSELDEPDGACVCVRACVCVCEVNVYWYVYPFSVRIWSMGY